MPKYYYDKFSKVYSYSEPSWSIPGRESFLFDSLNGRKYKQYVWDSINKLFIGINELEKGINYQIKNGDVIYGIHSMYNNGKNDVINHFTALNDGNSMNMLYCEVKSKYSGDAVSTSFEKGSLIQSNILAEDGIYPLNGVHTDGYWYVRNRLVNNVPTISGVNTNLGNLTSKPTPISYTVTDPDGDTLTITEKIDGRTIRTFTATSGTTHTLQLSDDQWLKTRFNTSVNMAVDVSDGKGGTATRTHALTRRETKIDFQLKIPFKTDVLARRILLNLSGKIPSSATILIEACNNALDTTPIWEDITGLCLKGLPYPFKNKIKTNMFGGVSFRIKIERGTSTDEIYLIGIGGSFD